MDNKIIIFTDGACSGNPGPGGWGSIIYLPTNQIIELGEGSVNTTNNKMELLALIRALDFIKNQKSEIHIYIDSTYVIQGATKWVWGWMKKNWVSSEGKEVANKELWQQLVPLLNKLNPNKIVWNYVRGHTGVVGNERCDQIAVSFSKGDEIYLYQGPLDNYQYSIFPLPEPEALPVNQFDKTKKSSEVSYYITYINGVVTRYSNWKDCEMAVKGKSGVKFKKVKNETEEKMTLKAWGISS